MFRLKAEQLPKYKNIPAVVLGNGPSRLHYDINALKGRCIVFGCNRIWQDYKPEGTPFFFGACDETIYESLIGHENILKEAPLIVPHNHYILDHYEMSHINFFERYPWKNTGRAMLKMALLLGCSPIFILGFSDQPIKTDFGFLENVYQHDIRKSGWRFASNRDTSKSIVGNFHRELLELTKKYPQSFWRIGDHSQLLKNIPMVEWNDLIRNLPVKYRWKRHGPIGSSADFELSDGS